MYLRQLTVGLEPDSLALYRDIIQRNKLPLDQNPYLTIMVSADDIVAKRDAKYLARIHAVDLFYSTAVGSSSALATVLSSDLEQRFVDLVEKESVAPAWGLHFFPHLTLIRHMPPLRRINRTHLSRLSMDLQGHVFTFGQEIVMDAEFFGEPNDEFNRLMLQTLEAMR